MHLSQNPPVVKGEDQRDFRTCYSYSKLPNEPGRFIERFKIIEAKNNMPDLE